MRLVLGVGVLGPDLGRTVLLVWPVFPLLGLRSCLRGGGSLTGRNLKTVQGGQAVD